MGEAQTPDVGWNVCVDFGTAFSKAAAGPIGAWSEFDPKQVRPLAIGAVAPSGNPFLLESAVFVGDTHIYFGAEAVRQASALAAEKRQALRSFKTVLSVPDLERVLETQAPLSIDPHRLFRQRDLIVLFLAYLTRALDNALALDPVLAGATLRRRYTLPAWKGHLQTHKQITMLFAAAARVGADLGDGLFDPAGLPLSVGLNAVRQVAQMAPQPVSVIFEATAAAAYSVVGLKSSASHLLVVDMGAGTTDFAALVNRGAQLEEIVESRVTLMQAGDMIDRILLDLALQKAPNLKGRAEQAELWRSLMGSIREVKESLFLDRRAAFSHNGKAIAIHLRDLEKDRDFKAFVRELRKAFELSLHALAARAAKDKQKEICVVPVGGGAYAPFIQEMVRQAKAPKVHVTSYPATPDWAHAATFDGNLAPIFPQLAIAIGGALAPNALLAAA